MAPVWIPPKSSRVPPPGRQGSDYIVGMSTITIAGALRVPGDKSITHRALMLASLARGQSVIGGALPSLDARSTARILRGLGAAISPLAADRVVTVVGRRRFAAPTATLHAGNSGTTARLMLGLLAAHSLTARLTGDASLRRRPMRRVLDPLEQMGMKVLSTTPQGLPLVVRGGRLRPLHWQMPVASAQIKSALLLAGMAGGVPVTIDQPGASRDHTERLLGQFGFTLREEGNRLHFEPDGTLHPFELQVPGDPSSAAFLVAAALLADRGSLSLHGVGLNPTRTGFLDALARMGATVAVTDLEAPFGEPVGTLVAGPGALHAVDLAAHEVPAAIDEIPILACLAARAEGVSRFRGLAELRVKESDRLELMARNLRAVGATAEVEGDDLIVVGSDHPLRGRVVTAGDHRIAMAFLVLGGTPGARITVDDPACAAVSFPGFRELLASVRTRSR